MAIVENKASEIGDVILIKASVPIIGLVTLASFADSIVNETGSKFFTKDFRYSTDGVTFSAWTPLTNLNISGVSVTPTSTFLVEYRYIRSGADATGPDLEFNEVELTGDFQEVPCGDVYNNSIFAQFFTCTEVCVLSWMINVLEKLYREGILPTYIERGEQGNDFGQDQDFIEFWKSITQYFAYIVCYARQWELTSATSNLEILIEYLRNQTFIFCGNETIDDLTYVMNNTYDEMRHRGTYEIIKTKADGKNVDGEWHRLFCHLGKCTDWYFASVFNYSVGWIGDKASPLWQGNYQEKGLTKAYEDGEDVVSLANYPIKNPTYVSIEVDDVVLDGSLVDVMKITNVPAGETAGIGHTASTVDVSELIKVSPKNSYEITFWVEVGAITNPITFGVNAYDKDGNILSPLGTEKTFWDIDSDIMASKINLANSGQYYFMRGIIYGQNYFLGESDNWFNYLTANVNKSVAPFYYGLHPVDAYNPSIHSALDGLESANSTLRFKDDSKVCYISPVILVDNTDGGIALVPDTKFYDIKVRHLSTHYSTGFEQVSNLIKMQVENFNPEYTNVQANEMIREFLIPYNSTFKIEYLNPSENTNISNALDIIHSQDNKFLFPDENNVREFERFLIFNLITGVLALYQYDGASWILTDNAVGNIVYVTRTRNVFAYDDGKWNFSSK